jgi:hypothetical protein
VSSFLSELGGITGGVGAEGLAFAAGFAAAHALEPEAVTILQDAWHGAPVRRIDPETAAEIAAESFAAYKDMQSEATYSGVDASRFAYLYKVTLTAPGTGQLIQMLRREDEEPSHFDFGLRKAKLDPKFDAAIRNLRDVRIPGPDLAYMVVRGVVPDGGTLPGSLPTSADNLNLPPQLNIDTLLEAKRTGWDAKRFAGLVARSGLAMAPGLAAQAHFRKILTLNDYRLTIARGDLFPAFADPMLEVSRQILTAGEYAELQLRGYYDRATRLDHTRKHGMTDADSDLLYDVQGRGLSLHSAFVAERRGGVFRGPTDAIPAWAMFQLQRGNLRPEVYNLAWAGRHTYPSPFVIRGLLTDGAISEAQGEQIYLDLGWPEWLAPLVAKHYAPKAAAGASADPHVTKAENQLWTATHSSYVKDRTDDATAHAKLAALGVAAGAIPAVLTLWQEERELVRAGLTAAQIKKAYGEAIFTQPEAVARLVELGWSTADATVYLSE